MIVFTPALVTMFANEGVNRNINKHLTSIWYHWRPYVKANTLYITRLYDGSKSQRQHSPYQELHVLLTCMAVGPMFNSLEDRVELIFRLLVALETLWNTDQSHIWMALT